MKKMEDNIYNDPMLDVYSPEENDNSSPEDFQKFIYELFDKNGVLNDLRAYLRGHIVDVLKNAQVGNQPMCQVRFTERLRTTNQALNILLSEYLLQQHLNYTLSVFVSEIPLANMVFSFSKMLLQNRVQTDGDLLRFEENDIWSILNYLGIKCDAKQAYSVVSMYQSEDRPSLLLCILKCAVLSHGMTPTHSHDVSPQSISPHLSSSESSKERVTRSRKHRRCNHMNVCKSCQTRYRTLKEKYVKRKIRINKTKNQQNLNSVNVKGFMRDVSVLERNIIDEMFDQLKSVYESELTMMRDIKRDRAQRSIVNSALELNRKRDQLNDEFKAREAQLESSIQEKKRFLWSLAKSLKEQHKHMERAMDAVKEEGKRLSTKEEIMKRDLSEAEDMLKRKGEEMRKQIADEVDILENYLREMRSEKCNIKKEREELDHIKDMFLFDKYIHMTRSNASLEQSTLTDLHGVHSSLIINNSCNELNNATDAERSNRVINNLKKPKNVNFSSEIFFQGSSDVSRERSKSTTSSEGSDVKTLLERLQEENARLIQLASHQAANIEDVSSRQAHLQAELAAARATIDTLSIVRQTQQPASTLPLEPFYVTLQRAGTNQQASTSNQRKGAGEQLSLFTRHRVVVPGDTVPFVGKLSARHVDGKRHLANQWRILKHLAPSVPPSILVCAGGLENVAETNVQIEGGKDDNNFKDIHSSPAKHKHKEKSSRDDPSSSSKHTRGKSPTSVLKEAKKRLRKLEIETEAVENSYNEFRKQRNEQVEGSRSGSAMGHYKNFDTMQPARVNKVSSDGNIATINLEDIEAKFNLDIEAYLKEYKTKINFDKYFGNKATSLKTAKPIPEPLLNEPEDLYSSKYDKNLIETPMTEFRKYYSESYTKSREDPVSMYKKNIEQKESELKILEDNLKKMYNINYEIQAIADTNIDNVQTCQESLNVVKEQVEEPDEIVTEIDIKVAEKSENNLLVVVENSVEKVDIPEDISNDNDGMEMTIIISPKASVQISQEKDDIVKQNIENLNSSSSPKLKERSEVSSPESNLKSNVIESIHTKYDKNDGNVKTQFSSSNSEASVNFTDSLSIDVDIYNSRSSNNSPISRPKSPDEENFWES